MKETKKLMIILIFILSIEMIAKTNKVFSETSANTDIPTQNEELIYKKQEDGEILISGFKMNENVSEILKRKFADEYIIKVKNNQGIDITNNLNTKIGTGNKIELYEENGETLVRTYTAVIYGDTNGDANVGAVDALAIVKNKIGKEEFKNKATEEAGRILTSTRESRVVPKAGDALYIVKHKLSPEKYPIDQQMKQFDKETITITFNANEGIVNQTDKKIIKDLPYGNLPIPTKEGYAFVGWFTEENGGTKIENTTIANLTEDQTLYAHWEENQYTLTVQHYLENANDNNYTLSTTTTGTISYGTQITLANYQTSIENGTYKHATLLESGTVASTTTITGNTTIYLYYSRNTYTLTLNKGDYIDTVIGAGNYKVGQNVQINATLLGAETGYINSWVNWTSNNKTLLGDNTIQNTTITMPAGNITLTANGTRTSNTYTISYNENGAIGCDIFVPESQTKIRGQNIVLDMTIPYCRKNDCYNYYFLGWSTNPNNNDGEYWPGDTFTIDQDVTLYAIWAKDHKIERLYYKK